MKSSKLGKFRYFLAASAAFLAMVPGLPALAWNDFGHMAVAAYAYKRLSPDKQARVSELLKLNPYYSRWLEQVRTVSAQDRERALFMVAATWPDVIKGDGNYVADGAQNGHRPEGATAGQNLGYNDILLHKYWHFVDRPFSTDKTKLPPVPKPNAQTQIAMFRKALAARNKVDDALKSYDLVWLLHLVGDVHQPLHCVTRASHEHRYGDNGGNDVQLYPQDWGSNLHGFWDYAAGGGNVSSAMIFADGLAEPESDQAADIKTNDWIAESFKIARDTVYSGPIADSDKPCKVSFEYRDQAHNIAVRRIALAGARLANLLNKELQ